MSDDREFKDKAGARDLGDPATDLPLTLRVHPDDDPMDRDARRVIRLADDAWMSVTGWVEPGRVGSEFVDREVADWPYTSMTVAGAAFLPADPCRTYKITHPSRGLPRATCLCGVAEVVVDRTDANAWHRKHRNATPQTAERGDMGPEAFRASGR